MKTLIVWMWAFWFAIAHHLSHLHPEKIFYAYEKDEVVMKNIHTARLHPYFFPGIKLPENIHCIDSPDQILSEIDTIIIVIPIPFIADFICSISKHIRPGTLFINCSKGINNTSLHTVSDTLEDILDISYSYSVLSGGMIAQELVSGAPLGVTIGISDIVNSNRLRDLFEWPNLRVSFSDDYKNIELFGALKNIFALYVGYLEGKWFGMSTIGYYMTRLYDELPDLLVLLSGNRFIDFSDYALGGDLIATCFGKSRNRYFGQLVWSGISPIEAVEKLQSEKKHAEWYGTLRWISGIILENDLPYFSEVVGIFFPELIN